MLFRSVALCDFSRLVQAGLGFQSAGISRLCRDDRFTAVSHNGMEVSDAGPENPPVEETSRAADMRIRALFSVWSLANLSDACCLICVIGTALDNSQQSGRNETRVLREIHYEQ